MTSRKEVETTLKALVKHDPDYKAFREKTTQLDVLGLRLPVLHQTERTSFSFYTKSDQEILKVWDALWRTSNTHEALSLPLFYYRRLRSKLDTEHWKVMKEWIERVENWEHADALCYLYSFMYESMPTLVEPTLFTWNTSKNPWMRRASIVSTIYYASKNRTTPKRSTVFKLIGPLIADTDPYVRKAVGWQLRECYNLWPDQTLTFIEKHLTTLSAISFSYATEKIDTKKKVQLKAARRRARLAKK